MAEDQGAPTRLVPEFAEFDFERARIKDEFLIAVRVPLKYQFQALWALRTLEQELPGVVVAPRLCITVSGPGEHQGDALEALKRLEQELPDITVQPCGISAYTGF
jgi:hypothetical protein